MGDLAVELRLAPAETHGLLDELVVDGEPQRRSSTAIPWARPRQPEPADLADGPMTLSICSRATHQYSVRAVEAAAPQGCLFGGMSDCICGKGLLRMGIVRCWHRRC